MASMEDVRRTLLGVRASVGPGVRGVRREERTESWGVKVMIVIMMIVVIVVIIVIMRIVVVVVVVIIVIIVIIVIKESPAPPLQPAVFDAVVFPFPQTSPSLV